MALLALEVLQDLCDMLVLIVSLNLQLGLLVAAADFGVSSLDLAVVEARILDRL